MSDPLDPLPPVQQPKPSVPILDDPIRREKLGNAVVDVAKTTAVLGLIAKYVPHPALKAFALFWSGLQRDPHTGALRPGLVTLGNLAPVPLGYLDPPAVGVQPNWWLPAGATNYLPKIADRLGMGIPQQRAEDQAAKLAEALENEARRQNVVSGESNDTLADLVAGRGGFTRAGELFATKAFGDTDALVRAAAAELNRRASFPTLLAASLPTTPPPPINPIPIGSGSGGDYGGGGADPLTEDEHTRGRIRSITTDPLQAVAQVQANTQRVPGISSAQQQEANRRAPPLLRELLTERTDP